MRASARPDTRSRQIRGTHPILPEDLVINAPQRYNVPIKAVPQKGGSHVPCPTGSRKISFSAHNAATAVHVDGRIPADRLVELLQLPPCRGLVLLNGGTAQLEADLAAQLAAVLADGLARVAAEEGLTVITGGTDAGIFHLYGQGVAAWGRTAPAIGVAVGPLVAYPGHPGGEALLEPHHSHFVLVAGNAWGDETATMYDLAQALSRNCPSLAIFAGGGEIATHELLANVAQGRRLVLLAGSGRATDAVLAARAGHPVEDPRWEQIAATGDIVPVDLSTPPATLRRQIIRLLFG